MLYSEKIKNYYKYLIYIIPVLYLLLGFYFRQIFGDLSLRSIDPEYIHFISGLCISTGKFSQANIDQPASIFHLLLAVVFRIVYFFREHNLPYFQDVIKHSDLYLSVANLVITTIISVSMLWAGKAVKSITGSYVYALTIQIAPLLMNIWYDLTGRIYAELLFVVPIFLLQVLLLKEIYNKEGNSRKRLYLYAFAVALGMSLKMTFLPFIVLPLFLIKGLRDKVKYLIFTVIFFLILSPPVVFQFNRFRHWMIGLFIHSGVYQGGNKSIINPGLFVKNIKILFSSEKLFFYALGVLALLLLVLIVTKKTKNVLFHLGTGLLTVFLGIAFITCKHYEVRYFIPAMLLFPFLLITDKELMGKFFTGKAIRIFLSVVLLFLIGNRLRQEVPYMRIVSNSVSRQMAARIETRDVVNTLKKNSYKIIVSQDYGCPFQEYAIMYSFAMGGKNWPGYREKLDKLYPNTYQYFTWDNTLKYWGKDFDPDKIIASEKPVYLYLEKDTKELYNRTMNKLFEDYPGFQIKKKLIFENSQNKEAVLQLYFSKVKQQDSIH